MVQSPQDQGEVDLSPAGLTLFEEHRAGPGNCTLPLAPPLTLYDPESIIHELSCFDSATGRLSWWWM